MLMVVTNCHLLENIKVDVASRMPRDYPQNVKLIQILG
jgi:hypothetical protein